MSLTHNGLATLIAFAIALSWLKLNNGLAHRGIVTQTLSRKFIHTGTGPLFVLCWPLFSDDFSARFWAALVPLAITLKFAAIGLGWWQDPAAVKALTRHGQPKEILSGPLYYGLVFIICTVLFWRSSPVGMLALMIMCGGDGLADIFGRRWGQRKLPFSTDKSWIGSAAMFLGGWLFGFGYLVLFNHRGYFPETYSLQDLGTGVLLVAGVATLVEALPFKDIDNLTLTSASLLLGQALFAGPVL